MKLSLILDNFAGGGKERRCLQLIQGLLRNHQYLIQVIIIDGDIEYKELEECHIDLTILYRKEQYKKPWTVFKEIKQALRSFHPDIVQAWGYMSAFYTLPLSLSKKFVFIASYVADVIAPNTFLQRSINTACINMCKFVIGNSEQGLKAYHIPHNKAVCIYNGFNEERFNRRINKDSYKTSLHITTSYVVSMIATFGEYKDWSCYIEAAKILIKKRKDITFLGIGKGTQWDSVNEQINEDERDLIQLVGRRDDIDELLQITDVSVLCTNPQVKEGLSNTIMESLAWGVPVIATAGGGTPEILEDGKNGLLIHQQKPENVARMIEQIIDDAKLREHMSVLGKQVIQERFLLSAMVTQYNDIYQKCFNT